MVGVIVFGILTDRDTATSTRGAVSFTSQATRSILLEHLGYVTARTFIAVQLHGGNGAGASPCTYAVGSDEALRPWGTI